MPVSAFNVLTVAQTDPPHKQIRAALDKPAPSSTLSALLEDKPMATPILDRDSGSALDDDTAGRAIAEHAGYGVASNFASHVRSRACHDVARQRLGETMARRRWMERPRRGAKNLKTGRCGSYRNH